MNPVVGPVQRQLLYVESIVVSVCWWIQNVAVAVKEGFKNGVS